MSAQETSSTTPYLWFVILVATIGPLQFGYHLSELNAPSEAIRCNEVKPISTTTGTPLLPSCISISHGQFAVVQSIYTLGGLIGALIAGPIASKYGRLPAMRATTLAYTLGSAAEAFAPSVAWMILGRLLSGIGAGASVVVCPIYVAETSPADKRGLYGAATQIMINAGILTTLILGYFLSHGSYWRIILGMAGGISIAEFLALNFVPETPQWLSGNQQTNKARQVLQRIRGPDTNVDDEIKSWGHEISEIEQESLLADHVQESRASQASRSFIAVLRSPKHRPAVLAVVVVMASQQLTGINSIMMYSVSILGVLLPTSATLLTVAVSALNVITTLLCAPLADKIGRKPSLLLSISGMGLSSVLLALGLEYSVKLLSGIATLTFVASFAVGLGPIPFILASELVGPEAVGATQSWALTANWISTFIVAQFFPLVDEYLGGHGRAYWVFAGMALLFGSFISWWVPETRGKANADEVWGRIHEDRRID